MTPAEQSSLSIAIVAALKKDGHILSDEERTWVRLAIKREAQSYQLRQAIIEKTLSSLAWSAMVAVGILIWNAFIHQKG